MARKKYREIVLVSYQQYMLARILVVPPTELARLLQDLQVDLHVINAILKTRYLRARQNIAKRENLSLAWDFARDLAEHDRFVQMLRVIPSTFQFILNLILDHPVFTSSNKPQTAVETQLAVTLYRMGRYGNGASVQDIARTAGISEGSVECFTQRCQIALGSFHDRFVRKMTEAEVEMEKQWIHNHIGCAGWREGWLMYDGTIVVIYQRPGHHGDAYYTRKSNYGLNLQVRDYSSSCAPYLMT